MSVSSSHQRRKTENDLSESTTDPNPTNDNPFSFDDVNFDEVEKRRQRAREAKQAQQEEERAIIMEMDTDDDGSASLYKESGHQVQAKVRRPNIVHARAKTTGAEPSTKKGFFGFGKAEEKEFDLDEEHLRKPVRVGNKLLACWPYDDYHLVQKLYYEQLLDSRGKAPQDSLPTSPHHDVPKETMESSIPVFSRPPDPPDIPTAVQGVSLTEFEAKAEQRSIAIVSTWLFDAGLIDELLVNGGISSYIPTEEKSSAEGVEVGQHGMPIEGATKMDKEIAKLRNSTKRQLALINARLNDGVAATGSEVQELVNSVVATKDDIGRLRELSTYVSNRESVDEANQFMLIKYPKLKQAVNARRNLARCFRELDFFAQIPSTCDRLREELHAGEYTTHEWSGLRSVCREHVELEIFLVEAEAGMKKRSEEDHQHGRRTGGKFGRQSLATVGLSSAKDDMIDRFLSEHVENVWELGDEIRNRIMSGIAAAFELAMNNPAGMVALVEAVEVYQSANDEYKAVHGTEAGLDDGLSLRFTDMRAAALGEMYKEFEARSLDVFRELTEHAADVAEEEEASNQQFSAVLHAANELTSEIGIVKEQMAPCFPPSWSIEVLWTTCVAHICSNNILQQIGGPEGHKLPDLTLSQLLDLVAWVETFREIIEESFPNISSINSKRAYLDRPPKLLVDNNKRVDIEVAKDSLAWVNKTLWAVHDLARDEFLYRTKEQTEEWLENVYNADHTKSQTAEGLLITSLCEDVYSLAGVQLRTIRERLTRRSEALVNATGVIFKNLYEMQIKCRDLFCSDLEECCAASNDFIRMSEKCEEIVEEIKDECVLSDSAAFTLEEQANHLLGLYSGDAMYAAMKTCVYVFEPIEEEIFNDLFKVEWEDEFTQNDLALTLVRTLDDFMEDLENFLDEVMLQKTIEAQIMGSVNFYIRALLTRASEHSSNRTPFFGHNEKAIGRMRGDVMVLREYFDGLAESMPTLERIIVKEFEFLESIIELVAIAAGSSRSELKDFTLVLQKRVRNFGVTKFVVGDIYHLVSPGEEKRIYEEIDTWEEEMAAIAPNDDKIASYAQDRSVVPGLRIEQVLAEHVDMSARNRPIGADALERASMALSALRGFRMSAMSKEAPSEDED